MAIGSDHRWPAAAGRQRTRRPVRAAHRLRDRRGPRRRGADLAEPVRGGHHPSPATAAGDWRRGRRVRRRAAAVNPFGVGLVVIAAISWASGSLYSRHAPMPRSGLLGTGMEMLAGGALLAVAGTITGEFSRTNPAQFSTTSLLAVAYLVVFGSLVAFSAYTWLLQHAPVSTVATYAYVNPIVAVGLGAFFLNEPITPRTLVASALIIGAVVAMVSGRRRDERVPAVDRDRVERGEGGVDRAAAD
ncbi:MAG: hypothetical protein E6J50_05825 [Chloroflexi bacterium]|nr:MAG: hypothetical protein E6J50_05825 [Chloroflexota bacterium]